MDNHSYAYYIGEVNYVGGPVSNDRIAACIFDNIKMYCYVDDIYNNSGAFYFSKCSYGRLLIPINPQISDQIEIGDILTPRPVHHGGRGNYGCIPKFIKNDIGELAYEIIDGKKVITLHIARHFMMNKINQSILELEPHPFPILDEDYDKLNNSFMNDNNIQGGVNNSSLSVLTVYLSNGTDYDIPISN